jgi:tetrathionate reductase subunit B
MLYSIGVKVLPMERVEAVEGESGKGFPPRVDLARRLSLKKLGALVATASVASVITIGSAHREDSSAIGVEGKRWAMVIDLAKCAGCQACVIACKTENNTPSGSFRRWVPDIEVGNYPNVRRLFVPLLCNQCESPPCVPVCPVDATWKRADGVVVVDWERCIGCRYCMVACPYGARDFDWKGTQMVDKCTFCAHRLENGLLPACVEQCPAEAMVFGDLNDANSEVSKIVRTRQVQVLKPELGTNPKVFYIGLPSTFQFESANPQPLGLNLPLLVGVQVPTTSVTVSEEAGTIILGNKYLADPRLSRQIVVSGEKVEVEAGD